MNTAKMSAFALRAIMGEAFDDDAYAVSYTHLTLPTT